MYSRKNNALHIIICLLSALINAGLGFAKIHISLYVARSVTIYVDSINNFADSITNTANALGFSMAYKKKNSRFPYGYGKIEFVFGIISAMTVIFICFKYLEVAIQRILTPLPVQIINVAISVMVFSIIIKIIMFIGYTIIYKKLNSPIIKTMAIDAIQDTVFTLFVLISVFISSNNKTPYDGYFALVFGILVIIQSAVLIYFCIIKLISSNPSDRDRLIINKLIMSNTKVILFSNIQIHDHGNGYIFTNVTLIVDGILEENEINKIRESYPFKGDLHINQYKINYSDNRNNLREFCKVLSEFIANIEFYLENNIIKLKIALHDIKYDQKITTIVKSNPEFAKINFDYIVYD